MRTIILMLFMVFTVIARADLSTFQSGMFKSLSPICGLDVEKNDGALIVTFIANSGTNGRCSAQGQVLIFNCGSSECTANVSWSGADPVKVVLQLLEDNNILATNYVRNNIDGQYTEVDSRIKYIRWWN